MASRDHAPLYQIGTFAAGNRLLDPEPARRPVRHRTARNAITSGHRACRGCGEAWPRGWCSTPRPAPPTGGMVTVNATGCLEVFSTPYPESAWQLPWLHSLFGNAAAVASGVAAALRATGRDDIRVVAQAGDGGTVDIGLGCLSGMFERNDDVLFVCYDNQGYMNTGVQRSGATPAGGQHRHDPPGRRLGRQRVRHRQEPAAIAMAHEIPYVATATVADLHDLEAKVVKAMSLHGARYLHVLVPCPLGWGSASAETIRMARLATQCGLFPVFEAEHGAVTGDHADPAAGPGRGLPASADPVRPPVPRRGPARRGRRAAGAGRPQHRPLRPAPTDAETEEETP